MTLAPASAPTLYFFGVTTAKSSIMKVFPAWAEHLGLAGAVIKGVDFPLHAPAAEYRSAVEFLKNDPLSLGALVTTHKIDLYHACRDQFDEIDPHARFMGETSCLSKRDGRLVCHAKDPISSGLSLDGFLPELHFERTGAELFSMGAGGSTIALTWHLMQRSRGAIGPRESSSPIAAPSGSRRSAASTANSLPAFRRNMSFLQRRATTTQPFQAFEPDRSSSTLPGSARTRRGRPSATPRAFPTTRSSGTSTIAANSSSSIRRARKAKIMAFRSRTAGRTSCMAGRRSSPRSSTRAFPCAAQNSRCFPRLRRTPPKCETDASHSRHPTILDLEPPSGGRASSESAVTRSSIAPRGIRLTKPN